MDLLFKKYSANCADPRAGGGGGEDQGRRLLLGQFFKMFMQFLRKTGQNNSLAPPPLGLLPLLRDNPGSATGMPLFKPTAVLLPDALNSVAIRCT